MPLPSIQSIVILTGAGISATVDLFLTCHLNPFLKPCNNRYLNKYHTQTGASYGITIR